MTKISRITTRGLYAALLTLAVACTPKSPVSQSPAPSSPTTASSSPVSSPKSGVSNKPSESVTSIPGWKKFQGRGVGLWLPTSFEGGDLNKDIEGLIQKTKSLGPDFEQMTRIMQQSRSAFLLFVFDTKKPTALGGVTNVNVTTESIPSAVTLDLYMDALNKQLPKQWRILSRQVVPLRNSQAGKITTEFTINGVTGKQLIFVIKEGNTVWNVTFSTGADEFDERLATFEKSIGTFVAHPTP